MIKKNNSRAKTVNYLVGGKDLRFLIAKNFVPISTV